MHARIQNDYPLEKYIVLRRLKGKKDAKTPGAYNLSDKAEFMLRISRKLGISEVVMLCYDDTKGEELFINLDYIETELGIDTYSVKLDLKKMCNPINDGLFYYTFKLVSFDRCFYISSVNNVDFVVTDNPDTVSRFRLLVSNDGYKTPDWAKDVVMYHIFVDRFSKSKIKLPKRDDCVINENWDTGIPKYAEYPGAPLDNNEFFGGSIYGIIDKLDYLESLGVNCLYLSPIFKAYSNHKYDTGDYMSIDEMFGGEKAFKKLLRETKKRGIHIILDGVFNHTGDDSLYFNAYGKYDSVGAYQSKNSDYYRWYYFNENPDDYESWWGIKILPKLNNTNPETVEFFLGKNGVVAKYLQMGVSGWRLDVADELPHDFLTGLRNVAKETRDDCLIIGEVWENATDKISYSKRRKYFSGYQLDSVMNYPVKNAIVDYVKYGDCNNFYNTVTEIYSGYPNESSAVLMNLLSTHDTERVLTLLVCSYEDLCLSNDKKAEYKLAPEKRDLAIKLLKVASLIQYTLPGMPCIFYGDEAGMEGMGDPYCRKPYPWGREEKTLVEHYKKLGLLKRTISALKTTDIEFIKHEGSVCIYKRGTGKNSVIVCVNMSDSNLPVGEYESRKVLFGDVIKDERKLFLPPKSAVVFG